MCWHGSAVVRNENPSGLRCPGELLRVWRLALADFIGGDRIEVRHAAQETPQDVLIKIVINEEPEHFLIDVGIGC